MALFIKKHWRFELVLLFSLLFNFGVLWVENRADSQAGVDSFRGYGGKLPLEVSRALEQMVSDFAQARRVLQANSDQVFFMDLRGRPKAYRFAHETLWMNEKPLITGVRSFHFEFRDEWGNLRTNITRESSSVTSIGYTIRYMRGKREIMSGSKVAVPKPSAGNEELTALVSEY